MKKTIITSLFVLGIFSQNCFGQLKVDSVGHVGIGALTATHSLLTVGQGYGNSSYTATVTPPSGKNGLLIENYTNSSSPSVNTGLTIANTYSSGKTTYGIRIMPDQMNGYNGNPSYSLYANAGGSDPCYGVAATLSGIGSAYGAAIIGSTSSSPTLQHSGQYAGYFIGSVRVTGTILSNLLSPSPATPTSQTMFLDEDRSGENVTDKLILLKPIQQINDSKSKKQVLAEEYKKLAEELGEEIPEDSEPVQACMSSIRYSIDEESLREVCPELVYEDLDGNVSINYIEMVPLLVQSIKELNAKIDELQGNDVKKVASRNAGATTIGDTEADLFSVSQNEPNPFTESTTIKLSIPKKTQKAAFMIYDMSGKQIKQININERGKTSVNITSEGLAAGMYLYSLIADSKVISTKRMILTK